MKNVLLRRLAVVFVAVVAVPGASGHGGGAHVGFQARVSYLEPPQPGVLVQVLGGHERLSLANLTSKTIVVGGAPGRPPVRIRAGETEIWAEPRIGSGEEPPDREGLVRNWRIEATADGRPFAIVGFLGYRPPPPARAPENDAGTSRWAIAAAVAGAALLVGLALAVPLLRRGENDEGRA